MRAKRAVASISACVRKAHVAATRARMIASLPSAVAVPEEDLHLVLRFADEDEEVPAVGVLLQRALDESAQPVDAVAHVDERRLAK